MVLFVTDNVLEAWVAEQCEDYWADEDDAWREEQLRDEWLWAQADALYDYGVRPEFMSEWFDYTDEEAE